MIELDRDEGVKVLPINFTPPPFFPYRVRRVGLVLLSLGCHELPALKNLVSW